MIIKFTNKQKNAKILGEMEEGIIPPFAGSKARNLAGSRVFASALIRHWSKRARERPIRGSVGCKCDGRWGEGAAEERWWVRCGLRFLPKQNAAGEAYSGSQKPKTAPPPRGKKQILRKISEGNFWPRARTFFAGKINKLHAPSENK